jgi:DNA-binding NtrC family response regulator
MLQNSVTSENTLLIVDDEKDILEILVHCATRAHVSAIGATSTAEADQILRENNVSALSLDFRMPNEDGLAFYERVQMTHPNMPAILITGNADALIVAKANSLGILKIIYKPFHIKDISAVYAQIMLNPNSLKSPPTP